MDLTLEQTPIPGLLVLRTPVHRDARGWFRGAWQRSAMTALGLPDFGPVQHNVSYNAARGSTRGIHAEPWDKLVTVVHGSVFGAWVDLREGETFGATFTTEIDETVAVFVPPQAETHRPRMAEPRPLAWPATRAVDVDVRDDP